MENQTNEQACALTGTLNAREYYEKLQEDTLSPYAMLAKNSLGRERPIEQCTIRTAFIRDRDRILHSKAFRRLKHKTQVFLAPQGDHYRTRLTHTLEVSQIARTITRALRLNEDLSEAIAMGHDLGHTPFGHSGEEVLNRLTPGGFEHNVQSLRVVDRLENDGQGLNLTYEVRDGILNHKKNGTPCTLEGRIVSFADRIAYINHDIDDSIRAGVLSEQDLPKACVKVLGDSHGRRINSMILDVVAQSYDKPVITMSARVNDKFEELREFMFSNVYKNSVAKGEEGKAKRVVEELFKYYYNHIEELPPDFLLNQADGREQVVADYIAGMTDNYAVREYERLFVPKSWIEAGN